MNAFFETTNGFNFQIIDPLIESRGVRLIWFDCNFFTRLMSTLQITRKMASVRESSSDVFVNLSDQPGGLVLKEEQKQAVEALSRKKCNGRSSHWFREIHYLSKLRLCQHGLDCGCYSVSQYFPRPVAVKRL